MTCRPTLVAGADRCVTAGAVVRVTSVTLGLHQLLSSLGVLSTEHGGGTEQGTSYLHFQ